MQALKYLENTQHMGIAFSPGSDQITGEEPDVPDGWFDASWVVHDKATKAKSMSGRVFRMCNGPILRTRSLIVFAYECNVMPVVITVTVVVAACMHALAAVANVGGKPGLP